MAFVILTLVVLALFRLFSGALGNASAAEEYSRALLIAESRLAEIGAERPLRERSESGRDGDGRFEWSVGVVPLAVPDADSSPDTSANPQAVAPALPRGFAGQQPAVVPFQLWSLEAVVTWDGPVGKKRTVRLSTLRLAPRT